jgi:poly-gamma-glutamate capsule biosynthesis protein CapA/YwtB (metallophosphatase superfamily)
MYESESGEMSIALLGDTIPVQRLAVFREPRYLAIRELLQRADAVFTNLEAPVHPYLDAPQAQRNGGGTYMTTEPRVLEDLRWLGINMLACGSSHADDYGPEGILATLRYLDEAGIVHAGSGRHLAEARSPAYLDTPRGRIALVAAAASTPTATRAGEQRFDTAGYPGVNGFRHRMVYEVDQATMDALRAAGRSIGWEAELQRRHAMGDPGPETGAESLNFLGHRFEIGPEFAVRSSPNKRDLEENLRQVRLARAFADRVVVSFHCHEQGGPTLFSAMTRNAVEDLADFAVEFAHRCVDEGADIFAGHGPQIPLGIELYRGRPIFYGLGTFVFHLEKPRFLPHEAYERYGLGDRATPADFLETRYAGDTRGHTGDPTQWEQLFAVCDFAGEAVKEIRLYPIELGFGKPRSQRGRPLMAEPEAGRRIVERVARLSKKYGTVVDYRDGIGVIRP